MSSEYIEPLPTIEELDRMDDLSGSVLYSAELRRLPHYTPEEEAQSIAQARAGSETARTALLSHCLPWLMAKATVIYTTCEPRHSDIMDLVGAAHLDMVEAMPLALAADRPVRYLMSVGALAMKRYCYYGDPLVRPPRFREDQVHDTITTVSLESSDWPAMATIAGPDVQLIEAEAEEWQVHEEDQRVYDALNQLSPRHRETLTAYYGLYGQPAKRAADIAAEQGANKKAVEHIIRRAKDKVARQLGPLMVYERVGEA